MYVYMLISVCIVCMCIYIYINVCVRRNYEIDMDDSNNSGESLWSLSPASFRATCYELLGNLLHGYLAIWGTPIAGYFIMGNPNLKF